MKLKKLKVENFRNHVSSVLDLQDAGLVVVRGGNYAGKSSIAQAISMLLTPSTDGLDATGRGYATKIRRGEQKAVISGEIQGKAHTVRRTVTLNTNTSGRTDKSECIDDHAWNPAPFDKLLETNRTALSVCLNTNAFMQMDEATQKNLLAKLALPSHYEFPVEKMDAVDKAIGEGIIDFSGEPFAVIAKAYKKVFDERTVINRQIKEFSIPDLLSASVDATGIQKELETARTTRQSLLTQRDEAIRKANEIEVKRASLTTHINGLHQKVETGKARIKVLDESILPEDRRQSLEKTAANKEDYQLLSRLKIERTAIIDQRKRELSKWKALPGQCSSCGQTVSPDYVKMAVQNAEAALKSAETSLKETSDAIWKLGDVDGATSLLAKHEAAAKEKSELEASLQETVKQGKATRAEILALGEKANPAQEFAESVTEADRKINDLTEQLRPAAAAEERAKEIAEKKEQLARLQAKSASLDSLCEYFGKDGIKAKLLGDHIGAFENKINEILTAFGYKCQLSIEPYEFQVLDARNVLTPVRELSGSEQLMFLWGLQIAVSRASGLGLVVADRMDTLLPAQRQKANKAIYLEIDKGNLEQAFLIMSDESKEAPKLPNAAFFTVEAGTVRRLA